jgi:hypothetical protein
MEMTGRSVNQDYTYGFNGKLDDKWNGDFGAYSDFGNRISDNRLGKWFSEDAHRYKYPSLTPYNMMANNPIIFKDVNGDDIIVYGIDLNTKKAVPILVVKTKLIDVEKYTEIPAQMMNLQIDAITHQPGKPREIDLDMHLKAILNTTNLDEVALLVMGSDAYMVNLGAEFIVGGGMGVNLSMVIINKGTDPGIYFYRSIDADVGLGAGVGIMSGPIDFNENSGQILDRTTFRGKTQGISFAFRDAGIATANSYTNGKYNFGIFSEDSPLLYSGILYSGVSWGGSGAKIEGKYYFSEAEIINGMSISLKNAFKKSVLVGRNSVEKDKKAEEKSKLRYKIEPEAHVPIKEK